ncbi:MAG: hypothetical protein KGN84_20080 [Acidobacteriota bacterium]|nr:hypothetical protein [Acidobacteriota bacterium]
MTYTMALNLARERSRRNGSPGSTELYKLLAEDRAAYLDYLKLRDRIRNGTFGEPSLLDPHSASAKASKAAFGKE